jgi:hypothetical protein
MVILIKPEVIDSGFSEVGKNVRARFPVTLPDQVGPKIGPVFRPEVAKSLFCSEPIQSTVVPSATKVKS